jgi:hypothetical protein
MLFAQHASFGSAIVGNCHALFDFTHNETSNNRKPCRFDGTKRQGVNINGCADRVSILLTEGPAEFRMLGGADYTLDISGVFVAGGASATE